MRRKSLILIEIIFSYILLCPPWAKRYQNSHQSLETDEKLSAGSEEEYRIIDLARLQNGYNFQKTKIS